MMVRPWVVSILSTAYDLKEYREAIIKLLKNKQFTVSAYELPEFPVETNLHSHDSCLVSLQRADIALVIIDKRSGGTYCGIENNKDKISITETEYFEAIKQGIPMYIFVNKQSQDELRTYKLGFKKFCEDKPKSKRKKVIKRWKEEYDKSYVCSYVEKVQTLQFIDDVQNSFKNHEVSNWMDFFSNIDELVKAVEGKLYGHSRMLIEKLAEGQKKVLLNRHTSTAFGMSLGDVFSSQYYIEPPHKIISGDSIIPDGEKELSSTIEKVLATKNSILIYGEAGYGKTTILAKCFSDHVNKVKKTPSYEIPLFLPLRNKGNDYHFDIDKFIEEELASIEGHEKYPYMDLRQLDIRFYCDGFDEIAETLSENDLTRIQKSSIFLYPLVLTCRQQYTTRYLSEFNFSDIFGVRIQMEKWNATTAKMYVSNFCSKKTISGEEKNSIDKAINDNSDLQQVLDSPLLITMFLWFIENQRGRIIGNDISRVEIFESWMIELSKRELSKKPAKGVTSNDILTIWEYSAWKVYLCRVNSTRLRVEDLIDALTKKFPQLSVENMQSWLDALFDCSHEYVYGTFHEQFMEYLVARLLISSCEKLEEPYPDFLKFVLRPEINRYFRGIWYGKPHKIKEKIYEAISNQYFSNIGKDDDTFAAIRVHAIYHLCRLDSPQREDCIRRAFNAEKHISVLLSLYFGAIKMGKLEAEVKFSDHLMKDEEYSLANRGYHLTYYDDMLKGNKLPFTDDNQCKWEGTLRAIERHFGSVKLDHFFLRRIDLITMRQLIEARRNIYPLTEEKIRFFNDRINASEYAKMPQYAEYGQKVIKAFEELKKTVNECSEGI